MFTKYSKSTWFMADVNSEIVQGCRKDVRGSIGKLFRLIIGIREMSNDVQLSEVLANILHVLLDQLLATYLTIRDLLNQHGHK
jgi:hypothetical protein